MKKKFTFAKLRMALGLCFISFLCNVNAQQVAFNLGSPPACFTPGNNTVSAVITVTPPGTSYFTWTVLCLSNPTPMCAGIVTSLTPNGSSITINYPCCGSYSVYCEAYDVSNTFLSGQNAQVAVSCNATPTLNITASPPGNICMGYPLTINATGATSYTWSVGATTQSITVFPTSSGCYSVIGTSNTGCTSAPAVYCTSVNPTPTLAVAGPTGVCLGSSGTFTVSGAATYTWVSTPIVLGPTINVMPTVNSIYTVVGTSNGGCSFTYTFPIIVDSLCAMVWPGDANSDGVVNSIDVFELGLSFNNTGAARTPGGNAYNAQYASTWSGTGSTGKNKCHIDCNGDGTVNNADTLAIYMNFLQTHSFKTSAQSLAAPDITILGPVNNEIGAGAWYKADIILGSATKTADQIAGIAFDLDFDNNLIESNSVYMNYSPSFLNANNQNVQFRKNNFAGSKVYAATVRKDGNNVTGYGKIAEFYFKTKTTIASGTKLILSVSNPVTVNKSGALATLAAASETLTFSNNLVVVNEITNLKKGISIFPNPATDQLIFSSLVKGAVNYSINDITGRCISKGEFTGKQILDLSHESPGIYMVKFETGSETTCLKLVIQ